MFSLRNAIGGILEMAVGLTILYPRICGRTFQVPIQINLKTLRITHSRLSADDIRELPSSCISLDTFLYESAHPSFYGASDHKYEATHPSI